MLLVEFRACQISKNTQNLQITSHIFDYLFEVSIYIYMISQYGARYLMEVSDGMVPMIRSGDYA